jgi:hypothetical protein
MWPKWLKEFRHYPQATDRRDVVRQWEACNAFPSKRFQFALALLFAVTMLAGLAVAQLDLQGYRAAALTLLLIQLIFVSFLLWSQWLRRNRFRAFMRNDLLSRRICWQCGGDLSGIETGTCGECGLEDVCAAAFDARTDAA